MAIEPFIGEISLFAGNFPPRGWAFCDGQLLPISQNTALFSLLGTTYGGNGVSNFALPDLRGRIPLGYGQGPGLSPYQLGQSGGVEAVTLLLSQVPPHTHAPTSAGAVADTRSPANGYWAPGAAFDPDYASPDALSPMATGAVGAVGGSQPHDNMQPHLPLSFIIALEGIYPSRP